MLDRVTEKTGVDTAIGVAVRNLREARGFSARQLSSKSGVSTAMISRIESGQTSPSISTLTGISRALGVPLASLFRDTGAMHTDFTHVKKCEGLKSTRIVEDHAHEFINLAFHRRRDLQFEAHQVTLTRQDAQPPTYVGHGVVFMYALMGEAVYRYGKQDIKLESGDSLSLDAELSHGFVRAVTPKFTFLSVQAEPRT
jgi:transcriptional regulator with XRE-family HTH domain